MERSAKRERLRFLPLLDLHWDDWSSAATQAQELPQVKSLKAFKGVRK